MEEIDARRTAHLLGSSVWLEIGRAIGDLTREKPREDEAVI